MDENLIAKHGINLLINNEIEASEKLFEKHRKKSPTCSTCYCFVQVLHAFLSMDEQKIEKALCCIKETLKICDSDNFTFENFKNHIFKRNSPSNKTLENIERKILTADCQLFSGILYMMKQELTGYIKGGWNFRKALKNYEKCHLKLNDLIAVMEKENFSGSLGADLAKDETQKQDANTDGCSRKLFRVDANNSLRPPPNAKCYLDRLRGAVSFGYGAFNLALSYIPPNYLRIATITGFVGDRQTGLTSLQIAYESSDMKSSLAMLTLLCYHCVLRPFFCQDDDHSTVQVGQESRRILEENQCQYSNSALFLFFKSRHLRCQKQLDEAISCLQTACNLSCLTDLQILCLQDLAWCQILKMEWSAALSTTHRLKTNSRWVYVLHGYLASLLYGIQSDIAKCRKYMSQTAQTVYDKTSLDSYVIRKASCLNEGKLDCEVAFVALLELLYLCNSLIDCSKETLETFITDCNKIKNKSLQGAKHLILGGIYKSLGESEASLHNFEIAIFLTEADDLKDSHITPFACFETALHYLQSDQAKGRRLLDKSACYTGYDLEDRLRMRIHSKKTEVLARAKPDCQS